MRITYTKYTYVRRMDELQSDPYIDGLVQDCSNSIATALELLQSCTKPSIYELASKSYGWLSITPRSYRWVSNSSIWHNIDNRVTKPSVWDSMYLKKNMPWPLYAAVYFKRRYYNSRSHKDLKACNVEISRSFWRPYVKYHNDCELNHATSLLSGIWAGQILLTY